MQTNSLQQRFEQVLRKYLPEGTEVALSEILIKEKVNLTISKKRSTKLGDYRAPFNGSGHKISVNHNLNQYQFLITLLHELAHLHTWNAHQHKAKPHGREWKDAFAMLLKPYLETKLFPIEIEQALLRSLSNLKASSCSDIGLSLAMKNYGQAVTILKELKQGTLFSLDNGNTYIKGPLRRTRYICKDANTQKAYLIHALAEVTLSQET
jgi:hypothetical protein